jgi:hypothetical protein
LARPSTGDGSRGTAAVRIAASNAENELHEQAARILARRHFRTVYELVSTHKRKHPTILKELIQAAESEFDARNIRSDYYGPKSELNDFLVQTDDGGIESSLQMSGVIANLPPVEIGFVFAEPRISEKAKGRFDSVIREILSR